MTGARAGRVLGVCCKEGFKTESPVAGQKGYVLVVLVVLVSGAIYALFVGADVRSSWLGRPGRPVRPVPRLSVGLEGVCGIYIGVGPSETKRDSVESPLVVKRRSMRRPARSHGLPNPEGSVSLTRRLTAGQGTCFTDHMTQRRFQVQYGMAQWGDKGYVVVDSDDPNTLSRDRKVLFTTHNKSDAKADAERRNKEVEG